MMTKRTRFCDEALIFSLMAKQARKECFPVKNGRAADATEIEQVLGTQPPPFVRAAAVVAAPHPRLALLSAGSEGSGFRRRD